MNAPVLLGACLLPKSIRISVTGIRETGEQETRPSLLLLSFRRSPPTEGKDCVAFSSSSSTSGRIVSASDRLAAKAASPTQWPVRAIRLRIPFPPTARVPSSLAFAFLATAVSSHPLPLLGGRVARPGTRFLHSMAVLACSLVAMWEILMNKSCIILGDSVSMMSPFG